MSTCPSCGRYVGPYQACPHCGAHITGRLRIRAAKAAALTLATVGLAILWRVATSSPLPQISIGQVTATMNMAYAQVEGWVVRGPTYDADSGYLAFTLADDTGEIRVSAYRAETDALRAAGRLPALGDHVTVAGTLRVRDDVAALTINIPEHLAVTRPEAEARQIGSITAQDVLARVRVRGEVWAVRSPYDGLTIITLRDATGSIDLAIDRSVQLLTGAVPPVLPGQPVEVTATVGSYRGAPQLIPVSGQAIVPLPEPVLLARQRPIGQLDQHDVGQMVTIEGIVQEAIPFSAGVKLTVDDGSGQVTVLLWQEIYDGMAEPEGLTPGAQVRVLGQVAIYRDSLEVIPDRPLDVTLVTPAPQGAAALTDRPTPLGDLGAHQIGERVTVVGQVVDISSFSHGFALRLDDGTGQADLLLWLSTYDQLEEPAALGLGATVEATGDVSSYAGRLEIVPRRGSDVIVRIPGATYGPQREIGLLEASDAGSLATVAGRITRVEPFSAGCRVWIADHSGQIVALIWDTLLDRLSQPLRPEGEVRVTGVLTLYDGALEIVPRLPNDVQVLQ
jgi:DNA/RNA endonuclease YhcR with UshA esterase domain